MKRILYNERWSPGYSYTEWTISEKKARKRFETRKDIAVIVENGDDVRVLCVAFFHSNRVACSVFFLTAGLDVQLHRSFDSSKNQPGSLFLNYLGQSYYDWVEGTLQHAGGLNGHFTEDGMAKIREGKKGYEPLQQKLQLGEAELALHYEPIPAFGEWDSILRFDRSRPADQDTRGPGKLQTAPFPSDIQLVPIRELPTDPQEREQIKQALLQELAALSPMPDDETLEKMSEEACLALLEKYEKVMKDLYPLADESCIQPVLNSFGYVDPHGSVYWAGVNLWASLRGEVEPSVFENTIRQALHSEVPAKRLWATKMIWKLWDPKYVDMIWSVLEDPMELIRESAVETLETFNNPEALPWLEPMKKDPSERVRRAVAHAIKELKITKAGQLHE